MTITECQQRVDELYALGTMWGEARAQWLESCLECDDQYLDCDLEALEKRAYFWAQNMYSDGGDDWLRQAMDEAEEDGWPM